jgi:hypothetical protein
LDRSHFDRAVAGGVAFIEAELALALSAMRQAELSVDQGDPHHGLPLLSQRERLDGAGRADLRAEVAVLMAASVRKNGHGRPQCFEATLQPSGLQHRARAYLETLLAPDTEIQEPLLGDTARRTDRKSFHGVG